MWRGLESKRFENQWVNACWWILCRKTYGFWQISILLHRPIRIQPVTRLPSFLLKWKCHWRALCWQWEHWSSAAQGAHSSKHMIQAQWRILFHTSRVSLKWWTHSRYNLGRKHKTKVDLQMINRCFHIAI